MKIIFFGPPGSGKGTQAKLIASELNIIHLSTGDILRSKLKDSDELLLQLKDVISSGDLVSDKILNEIIAEKLTSKECVNGFILDGYPRTIAQSNFFLSFMKSHKLNLDVVFDFKIDFKVVKERIMYRSEQEKRSDDNFDVIKTRLNKYKKETLPVSQFFRSNFTQNYSEIDASKEILQIQKELMKIINKAKN